MLDIKLEKKLPVVQMNFEEVKASLIAGAEKYRGIIVTPESLKDCKIMQKELSKTKNDLDTYRKGIKKEMLIPVTAFELQCKELISLVVEVESPIKDAILIFDDAEKEKKKLVAIEHINKTITELVLTDKYSVQLTVLDTYTNVSMSIKKLKEDIEKRGYLLQQEQQQEKENMQIIKDTIENCNKSIDAKMYIEDFQVLINANESLPIILNSINGRLERIKANELKAVADRKVQAEKEVLERIAKAEREAAEKTRIEERNIRIAKEEAEYKEHARLKVIEEAKEHEYKLKMKALEATERMKIEEENKEAKLREEAIKQIENDKLEKEAAIRSLNQNIVIDTKVPATLEEEIPFSEIETMYFIESRIEGTLQEIKNLSKFLKENNYNYVATSKGLLK